MPFAPQRADTDERIATRLRRRSGRLAHSVDAWFDETAASPRMLLLALLGGLMIGVGAQAIAKDIIEQKFADNPASRLMDIAVAGLGLAGVLMILRRRHDLVVRIMSVCSAGILGLIFSLLQRQPIEAPTSEAGRRAAAINFQLIGASADFVGFLAVVFILYLLLEPGTARANHGPPAD